MIIAFRSRDQPTRVSIAHVLITHLEPIGIERYMIFHTDTNTKEEWLAIHMRGERRFACHIIARWVRWLKCLHPFLTKPPVELRKYINR